MSGYIGNIPVPQATQTRDNFTATSGQTTFSTSGYTPSYLDVYLNGVHLDPSDYTATNGTDVVLGTGATAGDIVSVVAFSTFETVDQDFSGDFSVDGSTFVVDSTNDRVGIGTSSPDNKLTVSGGVAAIGSGSYTAGNASGAYLSYESGNLATLMARSVGTASGLSFRTSTTTSTVERMRIDSSGRVTMPYQPSMVIGGNQNGYAPLVTANGISNTVPFNAVISGNGTGFNTGGHTFTAPVAGNYLISVWGLTTTGTSSNELMIYKNGSRITRCFNDGRGGYAMAHVLTLSTNDYIQVLSNNPVYLNSTSSTYTGLSITLVS